MEILRTIYLPVPTYKGNQEKYTSGKPTSYTMPPSHIEQSQYGMELALSKEMKFKFEDRQYCVDTNANTQIHMQIHNPPLYPKLTKKMRKTCWRGTGGISNLPTC